LQTAAAARTAAGISRRIAAHCRITAIRRAVRIGGGRCDGFLIAAWHAARRRAIDILSIQRLEPMAKQAGASFGAACAK
jgi:hypothetical protein